MTAPVAERPYVTANIAQNSQILADDAFLNQLMSATENVRRLETRLSGTHGQLRDLIRSLGLETGFYLVLVELGNISARILVHNGIITAAEAAVEGQRLSGPNAVKLLDDEASDEAVIAIARLRPYLYQWSPKMTVYVKGIDLQHRQLVRAVNNLYLSLLSGKPRSVLQGILDFLAEYTVFHFRSEERFFEKHGYPRAEQHRLEHRKFVERIEDFRMKYRTGEARLNIDMLMFLADWIRGHIMKSDKDYGEWLKRQGVVKTV
ncbi:hypothetical protein Pyrde_0381 [Pyrodictium delaneyi]|uniref:Hemerythrin-like domain-containing protein n=1 Tax=Pyrodictium delaneyi TaxID=1273541 RepID=A0A0P0N0P8_9CREN|nr:bacteriohemerythrin [Pyrodictium delaneyi]ALL00431.1 hypothetical protein Pyrde_0381 [Pyrodictium delaneyi]